MLHLVQDPNRYTLDLRLASFFSIQIATTAASATIQRVNQLFPMDGYRHLKRIKPLSGTGLLALLVGNASDLEQDELVRVLAENGVGFESMTLVEVPSSPALTKAQYTAWNEVWPLAFFESMNERTKRDLLKMHEKIFESWRPYAEEWQLALLVVDVCGWAEGEDCTQDDRVILSSTDAKDSCCSAVPQFPLEHAVMEAVSGVPRSQRIARCGKVPYLLSGCIAILRTEPCIMCAMALLHSRIDAVVYYTENSTAGALGSCCSLHEKAGLNHEFPVYQFKPDLETNKLL